MSYEQQFDPAQFHLADLDLYGPVGEYAGEFLEWQQVSSGEIFTPVEVHMSSTITPRYSLASSQMENGHQSSMTGSVPPFQNAEPYYSCPTNMEVLTTGTSLPTSSPTVRGQPWQPEPVYLDIDIPNGLKVRVHYLFDDPRELAESFCAKYELDTTAVHKLTERFHALRNRAWAQAPETSDNVSAQKSHRHIVAAPHTSQIQRQVDVRAPPLKKAQSRKRAHSSRRKSTFIAKEDLPVLQRPLSEYSRKNNIPPVDVHSKVHRPFAERCQERLERDGRKNPSSLQLVDSVSTSIYSSREELGSDRELPDDRVVVAESWSMESDEVKEEFRELAKTEEEMHRQAFPGYKYEPKQRELKRKRRKNDDEEEDEEDEEVVDRKNRR